MNGCRMESRWRRDYFLVTETVLVTFGVSYVSKAESAEDTVGAR